MSKIIGISCSDAQLRYSCINYIYYKLAQSIEELKEVDFWLSEAGHFVVRVDEEQVAAINMCGYKHPPFISEYVFPLVRVYSPWDTLKYLVERFYGAPYEKLYSINIDKKKYQGPLTYQGWLNDIASSIKRYDEKALYNALFRTIDEDNPAVAIVSDVSTPEDVAAIKERGGKIVHILTEKLYAGKNAKLDLTLYDEVVQTKGLKNPKIYEGLKDALGKCEVHL